MVHQIYRHTEWDLPLPRQHSPGSVIRPRLPLAVHRPAL